MSRHNSLPTVNFCSAWKITSCKVASSQVKINSRSQSGRSAERDRLISHYVNPARKTGAKFLTFWWFFGKLIGVLVGRYVTCLRLLQMVGALRDDGASHLPRKAECCASLTANQIWMRHSCSTPKAPASCFKFCGGQQPLSRVLPIINPTAKARRS